MFLELFQCENKVAFINNFLTQCKWEATSDLASSKMMCCIPSANRLVLNLISSCFNVVLSVMPTFLWGNWLFLLDLITSSSSRSTSVLFAQSSSPQVYDCAQMSQHQWWLPHDPSSPSKWRKTDALLHVLLLTKSFISWLGQDTEPEPGCGIKMKWLVFHPSQPFLHKFINVMRNSKVHNGIHVLGIEPHAKCHCGKKHINMTCPGAESWFSHTPWCQNQSEYETWQRMFPPPRLVSIHA